MEKSVLPIRRCTCITIDYFSHSPSMLFANERCHKETNTALKKKKKIRVTHIAVISCRTKKGPNNEPRDWENRAFHVIRNVTWNGCRATVLVNHVFHLFTVPKSLVWTACLMKQALGTFILCYFIWEPICWFVVYHSDFPRWNFHSDPLDVPRGFWNLITKHLKWWHFF